MKDKQKMGSKTSKDESPSTGMVIAVAVQSFLVLFLVGFLIWYVFIHKKKSGGDVSASTDSFKPISMK